MSDFTANSSVSAQPTFGAFSFIGKFFAGIAQGFQVHRAYSALNAHSDSQLAQMGLTRQDVARTAAAPFFGK